MTMKKEEKLLLKSVLPEKLAVRLHKAEEGGYWAKTIEISCFAQGETLSELFNILTRAIYAYYNVPEKFIDEFGTYLPIASFKKSVDKTPQKPSRYTLDDILQNSPENIRELQKVS